MSEPKPPESLEEQLQYKRKVQAVLRRNKILRWVIPIGVSLILLAVLFICLHRHYVRTHPEAVDTTPKTATIAAVGDISLSSQQLRDFTSGNGICDYSACFEQVMQTISSADLAVGNLEGNVCDGSVDPDGFRYPESFLQALADCGFDILQTANSRSIQNGISGLQSTKNYIEANGMAALGTYVSAEEKEAGGVVVKEVNGIRFAFLGFTKGLSNMRLPEADEYSVDLLYTDYDTTYSDMDEDAIVSRINAAKDAQPDVIIAMLHWGSENDAEVTDSQKAIAELLFENDVDVIIGSHSHIVGPMEKQTASTLLGASNDVFVAYSLGDFLTTSAESRSMYGCILNLTFTKNGGKTRLTDVTYTPTYTGAPSAELGISHYRIYDSLNAISLYNSNYYERIPEALCQRLQETVDALKEQTQSDFQIQK